MPTPDEILAKYGVKPPVPVAAPSANDVLARYGVKPAAAPAAAAQPSMLDSALASPGARFAKGALLNPLTGTMQVIQSPLGHAVAPVLDPVGAVSDLAGLVAPDNPLSKWYNRGREQTNAGVGAINRRVEDARANTGRGAGTDWYQTAGDVASAFLPLPGGKLTGAARFAPDVEKLLAEGVMPTVGQAAGGALKRIEEAATSIPVLGDSIKTAQTRATADMNRATYNRVLAPLGQQYPAMGAVGRKGVDLLKQRVGGAYDAAILGASAAHDAALATDLANAVSDVADFIPEKQAVLTNFIDKRILPLFKNGQMPGDVFKQLDSKLRQLSSHFGASIDPDNQMLGEGYDAIRRAMLDAAARTTPKAAADIKAANAAFANYVRVSRAAGSQGARDGLFSAEQLNAAVRGADTTVRKDAFARGHSLMQDFSDPAVNVLGRTVPDSGTPLRWQIEHPLQALALNVASLPTRALYSKPGQSAIINALRYRNDLPMTMAPSAALMGSAIYGQQQ